jgi:hypothetical protein
MVFLVVRSSAADRQSLHPMLQVLRTIPNQRANLEESRAALQQSPTPEGGETHFDLFGDFFFG